MLAPFWTDLNDAGCAGVTLGRTLTDGVNSWIVVQWDTHLFSDAAADTPDAGVDRHRRDPGHQLCLTRIRPSAPTATVVWVLPSVPKARTEPKASNIVGPPTGSYVVTSTPGTPGGSAVVTLQVKAKGHDDGTLTSTLVTDVVAGKTIVKTPIDVTRRK